MRITYENFTRLYVQYKDVTTPRGDDEPIEATVSFIDGCAHTRNRCFRGATEERKHSVHGDLIIVRFDVGFGFFLVFYLSWFRFVARMP